MTVEATSALVHGVDVVAVDRCVDLVERLGPRFLRRVATVPEAGWAGDSAERLAGLLAVKESAIKALGGRPAGFRWQCVEVDPDAHVATPAAAAEVLGAFDDRLLDAHAVGCRLAGPALARARALLGTGEGGAVHGVARVGTLGGHVLATVTFWSGSSGSSGASRLVGRVSGRGARLGPGGWSGEPGRSGRNR